MVALEPMASAVQDLRSSATCGNYGHPLSAHDLSACLLLLVPDRENLLSADHELVAKRVAKGACFVTVSEALAQTTSAVRVEPPGQVRTLPRVKPGSAVLNLLNYQYDTPHTQQCQDRHGGPGAVSH